MVKFVIVVRDKKSYRFEFISKQNLKTHVVPESNVGVDI